MHWNWVHCAEHMLYDIYVRIQICIRAAEYPSRGRRLRTCTATCTLCIRSYDVRNTEYVCVYSTTAWLRFKARLPRRHGREQMTFRNVRRRRPTNCCSSALPLPAFASFPLRAFECDCCAETGPGTGNTRAGNRFSTTPVAVVVAAAPS